MNLIYTKGLYDSSNEYYKNPLLIDQIEFEYEKFIEQRKPVYVVLPIDYSIRKSVEENSISINLVNDIDLMENLYSFNNSIRERQFLLKHNFIINTIFEAYNEIKRVFRQHIIDICLETNKDPEEDFECIFIIVKTNLSPKVSLDYLDIFDEEFWLDIDDNISNILEVMVRSL